MASNFAELLVEAESFAQDILEDDIAKYAEDILQMHIADDIYRAYVPHEGGWVHGETYQRRYELLNMVASELDDEGGLLVTSIGDISPPIGSSESYDNELGYFLLLLEGGVGRASGFPRVGTTLPPLGIWGAECGFPRPAVTNTQIELNRTLPSVIRGCLTKYGFGKS